MVQLNMSSEAGSSYVIQIYMFKCTIVHHKTILSGSVNIYFEINCSVLERESSNVVVPNNISCRAWDKL